MVAVAGENNAARPRRGLGRWSARAFVLLAALAAPWAETAATEPSPSWSRTADPVLIPGRDLETLLGRDIDHIRLFAYRQGRRVPIPFQIDQRDSADNWVWDYAKPAPERYSWTPDPDNRLGTIPPPRAVRTHDDQDPVGRALFDANDLLVFLARDLGERNPGAAAQPAARTVVEIEVTDPLDGAKGWVYPAFFPEDVPAASPVRYMHHDRDRQRVRSPLYELGYSERHVACVEDLRIQGRRIVDRINIRGKLDTQVAFVRKTLLFGEDDIYGYIEGIVEGPIRIIRRNVVHLELLSMIRTPDVVCEHFYYPDFAEIPMCLPIRFPIKRAVVYLLTQLHGSPVNDVLMGRPDGKVENLGYEIGPERYRHQLPAEWLAFDTEHGSVTSVLQVPPPLAGIVHATPCTCGESDASADGELWSMPGLVAGFAVDSGENCPKGPHVLHGSYLMSPQSYRPGDEKAVHALAYHPLTSRTNVLR